MKAQHVVTGKDRDKAYQGIGSGICFTVIGICVIGGTGAWLVGGIIVLLSVGWIYASVLRLRGEI